MMSSVYPARGLQTAPQTPLHWSTSRHTSTTFSSSSRGVTTVSMPGRRSWSPPRRPRSAPGNHRLSAPAVPSIETEEEYVEFYQARITSAQHRQLLPLQEDLADWLNKLLETSNVTAENFMDALDDGLVVCRLARYIQEQAKEAVKEGRAKGPVPMVGGRMWQNAARRSFFSRDNTENFIRFCRQLGVHENLIFESDDLVMHGNPRSVVLCLLEVSRLAASRFGLEASGLVQLEREIAECASPCDGSGTSPVPCGAALSDSGLSANSLFSWRPPSPQPPADDEKTLHCISSYSALSLGSPGSSGRWSRPGSADEDDTDTWRAADDADTQNTRSPSPPRQDQRGLSELDRKVEQAARAAQRQCRCSTVDVTAAEGAANGKCGKLQVKRLGGAGKYNIAGRNVFVRLLKGRHMMVRVGGGWDTLEHFLMRHDPCQVRVLSRNGDVTPRRLSGSASRRQSSPAVGSSRQPSEGFLHIRAKYRSPPPARS